MNLRYILFLCLWISFFGCGHFFQNQSLPQEGGAQTAASPTAAFKKHTPNANLSNSYRTRTDAYGFKVNLEDKELESTEPNTALVFRDGENPNQKNTAFTKKNQTFLDEALDLCQVSQDLWQNGELENALQALDQVWPILFLVHLKRTPDVLL